MKLSKILSLLFIILAWANATASDNNTNTEEVTHRSVSAASTKLSAVRDLEHLIKTRYTKPGEESRREEYLINTIKQYRAAIGDYSIEQNDFLATLSLATLETLAIGTLHQMRHAKGIDLMSDYEVTRAPSIASASVGDWIEGLASPSPNRNVRNTTGNDEPQTVSATTLPNEQNSESELMKKNNPRKLEANGEGWWTTVQEYAQQYQELTIITAAVAIGFILGSKTAHPLQITPLDAMYLIFSKL